MEYLKQYEILLKKARTDIASAEALFLAMNKDIDNEVVLFHLQQATEKLLKAYLAYSGEHFPKTHDTELLFDKMSCIQQDIAIKYSFLSELDNYAVEGRYGDIGEAVDDVSHYLSSLKDFEDAIKTLIKTDNDNSPNFKPHR